MAHERVEQRNALRKEVIDKGDGLFEDKEYQSQLVGRVTEISGPIAAGDIAAKFGLDDRAKELWRMALSSPDTEEWAHESLLGKIGNEEALRKIWQEKFDSLESSGNTVEEYGKKLGLSDEEVTERALAAFARTSPKDGASYAKKKGMQEKAIEMVRRTYDKIDDRRVEMFGNWRESDKAESIYRHDMSHAINTAVDVGDLEVIKEGYRYFMQSIKNDNDSGYVERLAKHFKRAKQNFAEQGIELDPKDFYFDREILDIAVNDARKSEYSSGWFQAAEIAEMIGETELAARYKQSGEEMKAVSERSRESTRVFREEEPVKTFEELLAESNYSEAFRTAQHKKDLEKAKEVYEKAVDQVFSGDSFNPFYTLREMAKFVGDETALKTYEIAEMIR